VIVRLGLTAGLRNGLSRMSGNHHVRFLGEDAVERPHPYPTIRLLLGLVVKQRVESVGHSTEFFSEDTAK
jgi:hypothetical protein